MARRTTRRPRRRGSAHQTVALATAMAVLLAGCGASLETGNLTTGTLKLPDITLPIPAGFAGPKGTSTEIYERVARGALTCWLGASGPLKNTHVFHAVSQPARKGGLSQIVLSEKAENTKSKRGAQAARITIQPSGSTAAVSFENVRLRDTLADRFNADVHRWAADNEGCLDRGIKTGWDATAQAKPKAGAATRKTAQKR